MSDLVTELLARTDAGTADMLLGTITALAPLTVEVAGSRLTSLVLAGTYVPMAGDVVVIVRQGARLVVVDTVNARPTIGTVTAIPSAGVTVQTAAWIRTIPCLASYTPVVGHSVMIGWASSGPVVLGRINTGPAVPLPDPGGATPPPVASSGTMTFPALDAASWRGAWRDDTGDVIQGTAPTYPGANNGAWFYGPAPAGTLAGATVTGAGIYLERTQGGTFAAQAATLRSHGSATRPAGNVAYGAGSQAVNLAVGDAGWVNLDVALAQAVIAGGGLGINGTAYMRLTDLAASPQNGTIKVDWKR